MMKKIIINCLIFLFLMVGAEITLRLINIPPYKPLFIKLKSTPGNCVGIKRITGFYFIPGNFICTINDSLVYSTTHGADSFRTTCTSKDSLHTPLPDIILTGCSFTYGLGVDNKSTFAYITDSVIGNYKIKNHGGLGLGTIPTLTEVENILKNGHSKPKVIIYNYQSFHDERNKMSSNYRMIMLDAINSRSDAIKKEDVLFPFVSDDSEPLKIKYLNYDDFNKTEFLLRKKSALCNSIFNVIFKINEYKNPGSLITDHIILEINKLCKQNGIKFYVSFLEGPSNIDDKIKLCNDNNIPYIDLSINLNDRTNFNYPYDAHPSAKAHQAIAGKLIRYIENNMN